MTERKRKPKFSREELDILVTEVTRNKARLFGRETIRLSHADRDKIWEVIARKITSVSHVPRSVKDIKHGWDDMKRRTKDKLAFMQRSISSPRSPRRPSAIILTTHERAIKLTLHSSCQMHGFRRVDLDMVDSPSTSSDEGEEVAGPSQQHHFSSQRGSEKANVLSMPSFLHSSCLSDHSYIPSQREEIMYLNSCPEFSIRPPQPLVQNPPISGFDRKLFDSPIQQTEVFRQFCQELVIIHRDVASNMHAISQKMSHLSGKITQMCQSLIKMKDELQTLNENHISNASQKIDLQRIGSKSSTETKTDINQNQPKATPVTRITMSRKRKHYF